MEGEWADSAELGDGKGETEGGLTGEGMSTSRGTVSLSLVSLTLILRFREGGGGGLGLEAPDV